MPLDFRMEVVGVYSQGDSMDRALETRAQEALPVELCRDPDFIHPVGLPDPLLWKAVNFQHRESDLSPALIGVEDVSLTVYDSERGPTCGATDLNRVENVVTVGSWFLDREGRARSVHVAVGDPNSLPVESTEDFAA